MGATSGGSDQGQPRNYANDLLSTLVRFFTGLSVSPWSSMVITSGELARLEDLEDLGLDGLVSVPLLPSLVANIGASFVVEG